jgi:hypothetical protein
MNSSRTLWSTQFRWLTPSESDPYQAETTAIGAITNGVEELTCYGCRPSPRAHESPAA